MTHRFATFVATAALAAAMPLPSHAALLTGGRLCSLAQSADPTGVVSQDPHDRTGEVDAGPFTVVGSDGPANPITLICLVQVNNPVPDIPSAAVRVYSAPSVGTAVLPPTVVQFHATPTDNLYLCSGFWVKLPDGTWIHQWNDDDETLPGAQCALQLQVGL